MNNRKQLDITFANMFSNEEYRRHYVFYAHVLAQCKIVLDDSVPVAGVAFVVNKYVLCINPEGFNKYTTTERMAILAHEALHIVNNHQDRKGQRVHELFNIATDCAINQLLPKGHLPEGSITPKTMSEMYNIKVPDMLNAEQYYNLIPDQEKEEVNKESQQLLDENPLDNHNKWTEAESLNTGTEALKREITKKMIDKSIEKSRGEVPSNLSDILEIWKKKATVSWKKVLRQIASSRKANKTSTIMRKSRRFRKRPEIKGNKKDREWDLIVIVDTSGSMSDEEIVNGLVEINEVCKVTNGSINLLQVDTECSELESYNPNKKTFNRKHCGGTYIAAGVKYLFDNNIKSDALIVISDMEIENIPSDRYWTKYKKPVIFLTTTGLKPDICKNHQIFNIKDA